MSLYYGIPVFIFGAVLGSFLNVVIYRTGSGVGYSGRSKCLSCGKVLTAWMLIPLFSFLMMRGRCAYCGTKLSWQYPLVEALSGALLVVVLWVTKLDLLFAGSREFVFFLLNAMTWLALLGIGVYDLRHKIIPDRFSLALAFLALLVLALKWHGGLLESHFIPFLGVYTSTWIDVFAGPLLMLPFVLLWALSRGRAMGLGDAKLAWGLGWFLGFSGGVSAVVLAFWIAFFPSIFFLFLPGKRLTMKSEIPFAPFLILGTLLVFVWKIDILSWTT